MGRKNLAQKLQEFEQDMEEHFNPPLRWLNGQQLPEVPAAEESAKGRKGMLQLPLDESQQMMYSVLASASNMFLLQNLHFL